MLRSVTMSSWVPWVGGVTAGLGLAYLLAVAAKFGFLRTRGHFTLRRELASRRVPQPSTAPPAITFVCPVTRPDMAGRVLEAGLGDLDEQAPRILHANTGSGALVAAKLFNKLGPAVETEFVAFCHQDWRPIDRDWVARTLEVFAARPACEMVAQIGVLDADRDRLGGRILDPHGYAGEAGSHLLHSPDEQCFVLRVARLRELPFDEANLPEFHFYAVDYAYELQRRGFEVWSTPALGYHASATGAITSPQFKRAREVLRRKYGAGAVRATTGWI